MTGTISPAPVRRSVTVRVRPKKAFDAFTADIGRWWPATHSIGSSPLKAAVMEQRTGGRWYEIGEDGAECEWGEVLAWDPPSRILLAWRIDAEWKYDAGLLTEVEVRFLPLQEGGTRVELEHRLLENFGGAAEGTRQMLDSEGGWPALLTRFQEAAERDAA